MPPKEDHSLPPKLIPLLLVVGLILFVILGNFIPRSWFGVKQAPSSHVRLDLDKLNSLASFNPGTQGIQDDGTVNWNQFISSTYKGDTNAQVTSAHLDPQAVQALNDPTNLTGSFSKNLYVATAYLDQKGLTDENSKQQAVNTLLSQEQTKLVSIKYSLQDLNIAANETKATQKTYGNAIAKILQSLITKEIITTDIGSINTFAQTRSKSDLLSLSKNKVRVDGIIQKLLALSTPPSASTYQLLTVTRVAAYRDLLDNLSKADTDPVRSLLAFQSYPNVTVLALRLQGKFTNYFNTQNIVFSAQESGYLFTAGYTTK
jgi:hypothetical protein